ncbi:sulfotransferase family protein [Actinomadura verrucosospora]|uniref:Sulfotransferase n=1 Tax=Actinomadura verrucosospora TaxID=46165 RepID=A0A7D3VTB8_ACTVE|nr:sulfotransferase [Actinomadura verrucosospora]QKG22278.1 sulfotransferase [Actinomadura verrucosospora]
MTSQSHRPVFVLGCPRSGTTLLQQMLHSHRRLAVPSETRFVHVAYARRLRFGDLRAEPNRRALAEWITAGDGTKFDALGLDAAAVVDDIAAGPPTLGSALAAVFRRYAREHGKARWGDKRPSYFRKVPMLLRLFPDAQFVHLVRDGRDAVSSLARMPWYDGDVHSAALTWREAVDTGSRLARRLGPDRYYEMRYEDLVADPERSLFMLCGFLEEEYDEAMAEPHHHARRTVPAERRWHLRTHEAVNDRNVGAWAARMQPWEADLVEHVLAGRLLRHGYALTGRDRPAAAHLARFQRTAAHRWRRQRSRAVRELRTRRGEPNPVASLLTGPADTAGVRLPEPEH